MDDIQRSITEAFREWRTRRHSLQPHPDDETFASFIDGALPSEEEKKVRNHVLSCDACGSLLRAHLCAEPWAEDAPGQLLAKARMLLERHFGRYVMELSVRAAGSFLRIVNTSADVLVGQEFIPAGLFRSRQGTDFKDGLTVLKDFKDIRVELRVEKEEKEFALTLKLKDKDSQKPLPGLRVSLRKDGLELESYLAQAGRTVFERVRAGIYSLSVSSEKEELALVFLQIAG